METKYFEEELKLIKSEKVQTLMVKLLENVNEEFYHAPASSTGKYHPEYALGDGGLYRHTKAAVKIANDLLNLDWYKKLFTEEQRDYIICALILHDTCKSGRDWSSKYTMHTHPIQAGNFVEDFVKNHEENHEEDQVVEWLNHDACEEIARLIRSHMGQWNTPGRWNAYNDRTVLPLPEEDDEFFVHLCDYLASRKYLEVKDL